MKKNTRNTKARIVTAAWQLFYQNGYDDTTIEEIVELSETSKGSFYHYFSGKDALLGSLSDLFDDKYEELEKTMDPEMSTVDKLLYMNRRLFLMIENTVSIDLLSRLFSSQLITNGDKYLLNPNRTYYKLIRKVVADGRRKGVFKDSYTANDICKAYALLERGMMYDWCVFNGNYSLCAYAEEMLPAFLRGFCK